MNISDVNATTHRPDHLSNSGSTEPISPGSRVSDENVKSKADRVELSANARSAARSSDEITFARNALHNVPELSEARTAQIKDRIQSGYYNSGDVIQSIAERLGDELTGGAI